ncbi:MAG: 1-(5-phosphoribosyl)-5-((5-phosphoribosylamino)methylideneamino)imidazole-4-carboxamide isomerase [Acidimicrobiia bacterium]|nr:1-(5-phosphoribosyl)-5-((5-phosphoribosylamino)methylideneamino)imidazole-4-carboxamide isomerase [Acidimicrobiia bacterium]
MKVIPAVDVLDGAVVRLRKGDFADVTRFGSDPAAAVTAWGDQGAGLVHVVDLAGARDGRSDRSLWEALAATGVPVQLGGGLRTVADVVDAMASGIDRAVVGTAAVWTSDLLAEMVGAIGADRIVVAIDVRDGKARGSGWADEGRAVESVLEDVVAAGVRRALVTGIEQDGIMEGPDRGLLDLAATYGIGVIASGGISTLQDLTDLAEGGFESAIVGRALYEGAFTYREAATAASRT